MCNFICIVLTIFFHFYSNIKYLNHLEGDWLCYHELRHWGVAKHYLKTLIINRSPSYNYGSQTNMKVNFAFSFFLFLQHELYEYYLNENPYQFNSKKLFPDYTALRKVKVTRSKDIFSINLKFSLDLDSSKTFRTFA